MFGHLWGAQKLLDPLELPAYETACNTSGWNFDCGFSTEDIPTFLTWWHSSWTNLPREYMAATTQANQGNYILTRSSSTSCRSLAVERSKPVLRSYDLASKPMASTMGANLGGETTSINLTAPRFPCSSAEHTSWHVLAWHSKQRACLHEGFHWDEHVSILSAGSITGEPQKWNSDITCWLHWLGRAVRVLLWTVPGEKRWSQKNFTDVGIFDNPANTLGHLGPLTDSLGVILTSPFSWYQVLCGRSSFWAIASSDGKSTGTLDAEMSEASERLGTDTTLSGSGFCTNMIFLNWWQCGPWRLSIKFTTYWHIDQPDSPAKEWTCQRSSEGLSQSPEPHQDASAQIVKWEEAHGPEPRMPWSHLDDLQATPASPQRYWRSRHRHYRTWIDEFQNWTLEAKRPAVATTFRTLRGCTCQWLYGHIQSLRRHTRGKTPEQHLSNPVQRVWSFWGGVLYQEDKDHQWPQEWTPQHRAPWWQWTHRQMQLVSMQIP